MTAIGQLFELFDSYYGDGMSALRGTNAELICPNEDCPSHKKSGRKRHKLSTDLVKGVFQCWVCELSGTLTKLARDRFTGADLKRYFELRKLVRPGDDAETILLGTEKYLGAFESLFDGTEYDFVKRNALMYLGSRGITNELIEYYGIKFSRHAEFRNMVIIPSYDKELKMNFFCAREVGDRGIYRFPKITKAQIVFNEHLINWDKELVLVEGAFDYLALHGFNRTALFGTSLGLRWKLFKEIAEHRTPVNVCLDPDARSKAFTLSKKLSEWGIRTRISTELVALADKKDIGDIRSAEIKALVIAHAPRYSQLDKLKSDLKSLLA